MISFSTIQTDPWIVPEETSIHKFGDQMLLSPIELGYEAIYLACALIPSLQSIGSINHWIMAHILIHSLMYSLPMKASWKS